MSRLSCIASSTSLLPVLLVLVVSASCELLVLLTSTGDNSPASCELVLFGVVSPTSCELVLFGVVSPDRCELVISEEVSPARCTPVAIGKYLTCKVINIFSNSSKVGLSSQSNQHCLTISDNSIPIEDFSFVIGGKILLIILSPIEIATSVLL